MTEEEIEKIKEHIEIHARKEPYAIKISNNYYCHFALGTYQPAFMNDNFNLFVERSNGYSCEHHPEKYYCLAVSPRTVGGE